MYKLLLNYIDKHHKSFIYSGICLTISVVLLFMSRTVEGFAELYVQKVYPLFPNTLGRMFSLLPFSAFEAVILLLVATSILWIVKGIKMLVQRKAGTLSYYTGAIHKIICFLCTVLILFTITGSVNYSRDDFAHTAGITVGTYTEAELIGLASLLIEDLKNTIPYISVNEDGLFTLNNIDIHKEAVSAMSKLGERFPTLSGYYPNPKPIVLSGIMSYLGITGIFSPFTMEANYNRDVADFVIPYSITHELAHFKGYMKEEEAGFIAYLACRDSSSPDLKYSGTINALIYTLNALFDTMSWEEYKDIYLMIPEQTKRDLNKNKDYWRQHTTSITTLAKAANDKYLVANAQEEGLASYGKIVDLLLAEYTDIVRGRVLL